MPHAKGCHLLFHMHWLLHYSSTCWVPLLWRPSSSEKRGNFATRTWEQNPNTVPANPTTRARLCESSQWLNSSLIGPQPFLAGADAGTETWGAFKLAILGHVSCLWSPPPNKKARATAFELLMASGGMLHAPRSMPFTSCSARSHKPSRPHALIAAPKPGRQALTLEKQVQFLVSLSLLFWCFQKIHHALQIYLQFWTHMMSSSGTLWCPVLLSAGQLSWLGHTVLCRIPSIKAKASGQRPALSQAVSAWVLWVRWSGGSFGLSHCAKWGLIQLSCVKNGLRWGSNQLGLRECFPAAFATNFFYFCGPHFKVFTFSPLSRRNPRPLTCKWLIEKHMNFRTAFATTFATTDPNVTFAKLSQGFLGLGFHFRGRLPTRTLQQVTNWNLLRPNNPPKETCWRMLAHELHLNSFLEVFRRCSFNSDTCAFHSWTALGVEFSWTPSLSIHGLQI